MTPKFLLGKVPKHRNRPETIIAAQQTFSHTRPTTKTPTTPKHPCTPVTMATPETPPLPSPSPPLPIVAITTISTVAYKRRMEGVGDTYRVRKQWQTICPICNVAMQMQSIKRHYRSQHPNLPLLPMDVPPMLQDPTVHKYTISAPAKHALVQCPVPACGVTVTGGWFNLRRHFHFRHPTIEITIVEEGTLPQCSECGFQCAKPHTTHKASKFCFRGRRRNTPRGFTQQAPAAPAADPLHSVCPLPCFLFPFLFDQPGGPSPCPAKCQPQMELFPAV